MSGWEPKTNKKHCELQCGSSEPQIPDGWVIEKNVPIPPRSTGRNRTGLTACLRAMDVGDSVNAGLANGAVYSRVSAFQGMNDVRFETRTTPEGLRIWRVE